tara:strand:- start:37 stop:1080 length:1044 start_codon:yes stop_codon:yes gene_type:complete
VSKDYYSILGVNKSSSEDEIKKAYKKLALKYHPDRNKNDKKAEDKFKEINEAYQVLGDREKKSQYDTFGSAGPGGGGFPGGGFPGGGFPDLDDLINDFFGSGRSSGRRSQRQNSQFKGRDLRFDINLSFDEAVNGSKKNISVRRARTYKTCNACGGAGEVSYSQGMFSVSRTCGSCGGGGAFADDTETKKVEVKVPPGVDNGTRLRITGEGDAGINNGPSGDLYVDINVDEHPFFKREDENILCEVPISIAQAVLGGKIEIPTLKGTSELKIPSGIQPGQMMRLKGKGIKVINRNTFGDLYVKLNITIPKTISTKQKKLMEDYQKEVEKDNKNPFSQYVNKVKDFFN